MKVTTTNYATDAYSNLAGLASVAYNNPEYFREVKNQIFQQSPTKDLDVNLPSSLFSGLFGQGDQVKSTISSALTSLGSDPSDFKDWVDVNKDRLGGEEWANTLSSKIEVELLNNLDNNQSYYRGLEDYVTSSLDLFGISIPANLVSEVTQKISSFLRSDPSVGGEVDSIVAIINNNPLTKIDSVPPDTILTLQNSVDTGSTPSGASITSGFLTVGDYFNNVPYPGVNGDINNLPSGLSESVKNGYINYPAYSMEALFNSYDSETGDLSSSSLPSALSELKDRDASLMSKMDKDVYNISLMTLDLAGFTADRFVDIATIPKLGDNNDPDKGNLFSSRKKGTAFN